MIENFNKSEIKLRRTVELGLYSATAMACAKALGGVYLQGKIKNEPDSFVKNLKNKKEYLKEIGGQFFDKSPKIQSFLVSKYDDKISQIKKIAQSSKIDFSQIFKNSLKTGAITGLVVGGFYYLAKTVKNIVSSKEN